MTCSFEGCSVKAWPETIWHVWINIIYIHIICLDLLDYVCLPARTLRCLHCLGVEHPVFVWLPLTAHIILGMASTSISGIPSSAGLSPGTIKKLYLAVLSLCLSLIGQMITYVCTYFIFYILPTLSELTIVTFFLKSSCLFIMDVPRYVVPMSLFHQI